METFNHLSVPSHPEFKKINLSSREVATIMNQLYPQFHLGSKQV